MRMSQNRRVRRVAREGEEQSPKHNQDSVLRRQRARMPNTAEQMPTHLIGDQCGGACGSNKNCFRGVVGTET